MVHNILMQGDVTKLIEMSDIQRREIIDEIAGISEFDEKKEKSQKELEKVDFRVNESRAVFIEKEKLIQRLKNEKENAEEYIKLEKDLRKSRASILNIQVKKVATEIENLDKKIQENSLELEKHDKDVKELETSIEKGNKKIQSDTEELISKSKDYEIIRKIDSMKSEIIRKRDKMVSNVREIDQLSSMNESSSFAVREILKSGISGIIGSLGSLIKVPSKYSTAAEVALGRHVDDVIVETKDIAIQCVKYLKQRKNGRVRFVPLDTIMVRPRSVDNSLEYIIDIVSYERKIYNAVLYALGSTAVVDNIESARSLKNVRAVTLDGDLVEKEGSIIGGFYKKKRKTGVDTTSKLEEENEMLDQEIEEMEKQVIEFEGRKQEDAEKFKNLEEARKKEEKEIENKRLSRKEFFDKVSILSSTISSMKISKAKLEARIDNFNNDLKEFSDITKYYNIEEGELQQSISSIIEEIRALGPINMKAIEEYDSMKVEFNYTKQRLDKLIEEKNSIIKVIEEVELKRREEFMKTFESIAASFSDMYRDITSGIGVIRLENDDIESGLIIEASPQDKKILNINSMSGGEKVLTSLSFLFAIMEYQGSPFYVLDEIDAALDKPNTNKIVNLIKNHSSDRQFIVISHNDYTMQEANNVFGVSMDEGVSKIFSIKMPVSPNG